ncbi:tyrosine-type recombinase/integrase [Pararhodobacter aggregans]
MPRLAKELSALDVRRLEHPGRGRNVVFPVGGVSGLGLQITPTGARTWLLRVSIGGRRREIGMGGFPEVSLAQARERAREAKDAIRQGIDPVEERKAARAALVAARRRGLTFSEAVDKYLSAKEAEFSNAKHKAQWRSTLETYAVPALGDMAVQAIDVRDVLRVLQPIWQDKTETASRLRGRIEAVLSWATVYGHRMGDNPARWKGNLKELLPAAEKVAKKENWPAIALDEAAAWMADLRTRGGMGALALQFIALTAARSGDVRGATWGEIDMNKGLWVVPGPRMKMKREHRVPLSSAALDVLRALPGVDGADKSALVFPAIKGGELSDMTISAAMKRLHEAKREAQGPDLREDEGGYRDPRTKRPAVPHGLRSTFRDWVAERTSYPGDMAEVALAHRISNAVEAAYRRGDMVEKRRRMMADWADFLTGAAKAGQVVRIG